MSGGRPTDYHDGLCDEVIALGREGKSHAQIAAALDVSRQTLYNWQQTYPQFLDAITRARDLSQAWFEDKGQEGLSTREFNAPLWAKQMSARFREEYSERTVLAGDKDAPLTGMTDEDLAAKLRAFGIDPDQIGAGDV